MAKIKSLTDQVYDHIIEKIRFGELTEGCKIDEATLTEEIGTSRTPIREALLKLASDRVLEAVPRKGFFVKGHTMQEFYKAYSIIACLEVFAIRQVRDQLNDYDFSKMSNLIELMDIAISFKDYPRYVENQELFHMYCIEKADNETLVDMINSIKKQFPRQTYYSDDPEKLAALLKSSNDQHRQILQAIHDKNITALETLMLSHWTGSEAH